MGNRFYIVDVFAEEKYAGNQLAVIRDAATLQTAEIQKIARETNYSETTFILSDTPRDGGYDVRIFTPEREIPFAGHPTLGTAYIIHSEIEGCAATASAPVSGAGAGALTLNLKVGRIPVTFTRTPDGGEVLWMKQVPPVFGSRLDPRPVLESIGLAESDLDERFPVQEVSTGLPFIITPLKSLRAVKKARVDREKFAAVIEKTEAKDILLFCAETYHPENRLNVRVFAEYEGVPEDPATGSANGCLAGYLVKHRYFGENRVDVRVEQGYEIGRPSLLLLKAEERGESIDVFVGGKVVMVARGELV
ncbi:MAG: PhzF family phenazine biosynthesis protein [Ignavibacteriales bacterium]